LSYTYGINNVSGFVWQGLVDLLSGPDFGWSLIGLIGLIIVLGILFMRGADFGLIIVSLILFSMLATIYGLLPGYLLYVVYAVAGGIILMAILKFAGR